MKVDILDHDVFNAISPVQVEQYLATRNWVKKRLLPNDVSIWDSTNEIGQQRFRIWLPETTDFADYSEAMAKVVRVLAQAENRSQIQILDDFETEGIGDVIRLSSYDVLNRHSGTLQYDDGAQLIQQAREMTVAAALSARASSISNRSEHTAVFYSGRPRQIQTLERSLRLGQTEHGSYTIKLIVPISEEENPDVQKPELSGMPERIPFSRQAVMKLASGLDALYEIGREADRTGRYRFDPFVESVRDGVSANLCDAVSNRRYLEQNRSLDVSVSWSYLLQSPNQNASFDVEFPPSYMTFYKQASEDFRRREPEVREFHGFVRILQREQGANEGIISLSTVYDGAPRIIRMRLEGEAYQTALRSHNEDIYIAVTGEVEHRGTRSLWLISPRNLIVEQTLPFPEDNDE